MQHPAKLILFFISLALCRVPAASAQDFNFGPPTGLVNYVLLGGNVNPPADFAQSIITPPLTFDTYIYADTETTSGAGTSFIFDFVPGDGFNDYSISTVPEPTTLALAAAGAAILILRPRRR